MLAHCNPGGLGFTERVLSSDYGQTTQVFGGGVLGSHYHARAGIDQDRIVFFRGAGISPTMFTSDDNGETYTTATTAVQVSSAEDIYATHRVAFDPFGEFGICPVTDGKFWTSDDQGDTWEVGETIYNEGDGVTLARDGLGSQPAMAVAYVKDGQQVVIAGAKDIGFAFGTGGEKRGKIMLSADGGVTWIDKTGNLAELGAFDDYDGNQNGLFCKQIEILYK